MKPYYQNDKTIVYACDFREIIDTLSGDMLVVTDPPYNINFKYDQYIDSVPEDEYIKTISMLNKFSKIIICHYPIETMKYIVPALGVPDAVSAWCYNANIPNRFRLISYYGCKPDYSKVKQPYKNPDDKRVAKYINGDNDGTNLYEWWSDIQLVKNVSEEKNLHPCPVPEKLQSRLIKLCGNKDDVIFDPFCGGLTTLKAAQDLGYKSVGCEISKNYIDSGLERLFQLRFA